LQTPGETRRYAIAVPLQLSLGPIGIANFAKKSAEMLPEVKRLLRERGVTALQTFLFQTPAVAKPSFFVTLTMPASIDAKEAFVEMLREERLTHEWEQLVTSAHDAVGSKNNAWYATIVPEIQGAAPDAADEAAVASRRGSVTG